MINIEALDKIKVLEQEYKNTYGKEVDYTIIPPGLSQEKLVNVLKRMIDTNESIIVAYNKIRSNYD